MNKYVCVRQCFHAGRLFIPGEYVTAGPGEAVPRHFKPVGKDQRIEDVSEEVKKQRLLDELKRYGVSTKASTVPTLERKVAEAKAAEVERMTKAQAEAKDLGLDFAPDTPVEILEEMVASWHENAENNAPPEA